MAQTSGNFGSSTVVVETVNLNLARSETAATEAIASAAAAALSETNAGASETAASASETTASAAAAAASISETNTAVSESNAASSAANALNSEISAAGDLLLTNADAVDTAADAAQTALDRIATAADVVTVAGSEAATSADALATAADVVSTNADVVLTHADVLLTNADAAATAADLVQTNLDTIATAADVVSADASAVSAAASAAAALPSLSSASRNQVLNQDPLSQGLSQRVGFSSTTYTGNGIGQSVATGVDMTTGDFGGLVWIKNRDDATEHKLFDTARGALQVIESSTTGAEVTQAGSLSYFDSTGFSVGTNNSVNGDTDNIVAWSFQTTAKFSGTTNRNRTYAAHYNPEMGFSIVGYVGDGVAGHEIPHHLGQEPELSIFKNLDIVSNWPVISPLFGTGEAVFLESTAALGVSANTDTIFGQDTTTLDTTVLYNASAQNHIQYNFASVKDDAGLNITKVGKYTGTGVAGNYVDCNFGDKAAGFVLVKNLTAVTEWAIFDASRNSGDAYLLPSSPTAEVNPAATLEINLVEGGFVVVGTNGTVNTVNQEYIFYAIADNTGTTGQSEYDYPTTADTLTIEQDTLISFAGGFSASGETNVQENVPAATTLVLGTGFEDKKLYVYKDEGGAYGTTEYRPLEDQDYSGVQTPNQVDKNLRTTAKHFDYESSTGVASASGEFNDNLAWRAFNKDSNNVIPGSISQWVVASITTSNLQYKLSEKRILKSWRIRGAQSSAWNPKRFTIEGSNDGFAWTAIDSTYTASDFTVAASLWSPLQDTSANTTAYLYHRINITANNGDATYTGVAELEFNTELPSDRYDVSEGVMYGYRGDELVTNGDFATDTDWTKGTGWSIGSGVASCDGTQVASSSIYTGDILPAGKTYTLQFTVTALTAGRITNNSSGNSSGWITSTGTFSETFTTTALGGVILQGGLNFVGSIDNVSVKQVKPAINRVYLGELRTDTDGNIINESIVNYTPNKLKGTDAELHGDLIVRGEISNQQVATAWVNFDGTQNPPLIRSSYNVKDIVDLGTGYYEIVFETPMDNGEYSAVVSAGRIAGGPVDVYAPLVDVPSVNSFRLQTTVSNTGSDMEYVYAQFFGGKS